MARRIVNGLMMTVALVTLGVPAGCSSPPTPTTQDTISMPEYDRPLPPGRSGLRLVTDPGRMPDLGAAYLARDALLVRAMDASLEWFAAPSSQTAFPFDGITHRQARASVVAARELLRTAPDESVFVGEMQRLFHVYESVGYNNEGIVLFTGYYAPVIRGSRTRTDRFRHPLYRRPADLLTDATTGEPLGRQTSDGRREPYPTRQEIETSKMFAGIELVWLEDSLMAYLAQVNGSAKIKLTDGTTMYVGYAGKTDRAYGSLGAAMVEAGLLQSGQVTLSGIKRVHKRDPATVERLMYRNESYVFFTTYNGEQWPAGSLGVRVTGEASLATDKKVYPRGGLVVVDTEAVTFAERQKPFLRFMLDQDTGGAIRAPGRADIFLGIGPGAEILAGGQHAEGRLYYLFLKPQFVRTFASAARR